MRNLDDCIKDLLAQEREIIGLKAKGYIKPEDYEVQHGDLLRQLKEIEADFMRESKRTVNGVIIKFAAEYSDRLAPALEVAEIDGYKIIFKFKNGATVVRIFNNDVDRKATWSRKKEANYGR